MSERARDTRSVDHAVARSCRPVVSWSLIASSLAVARSVAPSLGFDRSCKNKKGRLLQDRLRGRNSPRTSARRWRDRQSEERVIERATRQAIDEGGARSPRAKRRRLSTLANERSAGGETNDQRPSKRSPRKRTYCCTFTQRYPTWVSNLRLPVYVY